MHRADHLVITVWLILLLSLVSLTTAALAEDSPTGSNAQMDQALGALAPLDDPSWDRQASRQVRDLQAPDGQASPRGELAIQYQMHRGNNRHGPSPQAMLSVRRPVAPQAHALASKRLHHPMRFSVKFGASGGNGRQ